jgi:hypothetical protein
MKMTRVETPSASDEDNVAVGLLRLPTEILHKIKNHLHDLASHVYVSQACKVLRELYNEKTWRRLVTAAGRSMSALPYKPKT